jgi:hypothetical protein
MIKDDEKQLFRALLNEPKGDAGGLFWRIALFEQLGINEKRVDYILQKWSGKRIWDSGVTDRTGWFTFTGGFNDPIRAEHLDWFLELSGGRLPGVSDMMGEGNLSDSTIMSISDCLNMGIYLSILDGATGAPYPSGWPY